MNSDRRSTAIRSRLKKRILVQAQGGAGFQSAGILKYVEELKRGTNTGIGLKDFFKMASSYLSTHRLTEDRVRRARRAASMTNMAVP